ncbi:MAG: prolyl aminopeptidase [Gammaproteobacteria bacterium]|jgi:proline iminopeptidase|nr:prolyl aminopeptidase [Gammaproteobacteria bacterium]MBT4146256.1 prolyl aminopeptidase [Gammaproteobacteria bacterium]MBT5223449.1 prolyl aminopeptidase [Gammaproteobacteria bacterium]MBT5826868.1 prolyl aminopeptidase [Gammaproteobacteria bacterium]MBT5966353.1 prolyl aminopeptidase [Gammaproteobacteria bacterium]
MKSLYPEIEPFNIFFLETGSQHQVYVEQSGNPEGIPVVFLHGGPCSGTRSGQRCFFDPAVYHIVLFDQRGCGLSQPFGELENNTTQDLIEDMDAIRKQLNFSQWLLFSGSWGSALALLYAQQYTEYVSGMIIRGVFLARQQDLDWFVREGASRIYPEQYQCLLASLPEQNIDLLYTTLWSDDERVVRKVTQAWMHWSSLVAVGEAYQKPFEPEAVSQKMIDQVRMELNYARNHYFIKENQILESCGQLQNIPAIIIHGRHDLVCPLAAGYSLAKALPNAEYKVLEHAGHIAEGEQMIDALVSAGDQIATRLANE